MSNAFNRLSIRFRNVTHRVVLALMLGFAWCGWAQADVDVNSADEATLTEVRGIGPAMARRIVEARQKDGAFRDVDDLADRVPGVGPKSAANLQDAGLTFGKPGPAGGARKEGKGATATAEKGGQRGGQRGDPRGNQRGNERSNDRSNDRGSDKVGDKGGTRAGADRSR
ncbi:ComEA family DNA-binding protein [Cupriavidus sp. Marseille-Q8015]